MIKSLRYGSGSIKIDTPPPPHCEILEAKKQTPLLSIDKVNKALDHPILSRPFAENFSSGDKVTIIVSDITRSTGATIFLEPMLGKLNSIGIKEADITILFANGTHQKQSQQEKRSIVGDAIYERIKTEDHDPGASDLLPLQVSAGQPPVLLNKLVIRCDKLVVTGLVALHYLAGYGGGRKGIMPGVASRQDAIKFHKLSINKDGAARRANTGAGSLENNLLHLYATNVMNALGPTFVINTIADGTGRIVDVTAGDPIASFDAAQKIATGFSVAPIAKLADAVVASCGGHPKDINFIQAHKTYDNIVAACKPGGKIFLAAKCTGGVGSDTFPDWLRYKNEKEFTANLIENFDIHGQTALATVRKSASYETVLLSDLDPAKVRAMGIRPASDIESFTKEASLALGKAKSGLVIPDGGYILPQLAT